MSWNYRIVKYGCGCGYGLHEVHYDAKGRETMMGDHPAGFVGDTAEEVRDALMLAKMDATRRPIFQEPKAWVTPERKRLAERFNSEVPG